MTLICFTTFKFVISYTGFLLIVLLGCYIYSCFHSGGFIYTAFVCFAVSSKLQAK